MLLLLTVAIAAGVALIRIGWGGQPGAAALGWLAGCLGFVGIACSAGAWGLAIGFQTAVAIALVLVLWAGARSSPPVRSGRAPTSSIEHMRRSLQLTRRFVVFLLVVPAAGTAAFWFVFAAQAAARRRIGMADADASVLLLLGFPIAWTLLMCWQMTRGRAVQMIAAPVAVALSGLSLWVVA